MEGVVINLTKSEVSSIFDMNRIQNEKELRTLPIIKVAGAAWHLQSKRLCKLDLSIA